MNESQKLQVALRAEKRFFTELDKRLDIQRAQERAMKKTIRERALCEREIEALDCFEYDAIECEAIAEQSERYAIAH